MGGTIFGVGPLEILAIAVLILLVFGPERLPELMRQAGTAIRNVRKFIEGFSNDFRQEIAPYAKDIDEVTKTLREDIATIREATDIRAMIPPIDLSGASATEPTKSIEAPADRSSSFGVQNDNPFAAQVANATADLDPKPPEPPARASGLAADNPWATGETPARRQAALDADNPWRA